MPSCGPSPRSPTTATSAPSRPGSTARSRRPRSSPPPRSSTQPVRRLRWGRASFASCSRCAVRTLRRLCELVPVVRAETGLNVAVSAGILTDRQAGQLAAAGVHRYNHNLETARSFFGSVVTTHTWEERAETCRLVKAHGMELCCGVLLGMGETDDHRLELLAQLRALAPDEVPVNFLNPRPGTPLGGRQPVQPWEAIRWIALFRLGLPGVILRYAGGREITLRELQALGMTAGINALIVGNYLTTLGRSPAEDLQMLEDLRMPIGALSAAI